MSPQNVRYGKATQMLWLYVLSKIVEERLLISYSILDLLRKLNLRLVCENLEEIL